MLRLEPGNGYALVLRGRAALEAGDTGAAIAALTKVADLDTNPEALRTLFQAYLRTKKFSEAGPLALKLATVHDDSNAITEYADALLEAQQYREALRVYADQADRFVRSDPGKLIEALGPIVGQVKDDPEALETALSLYQKAGDTAHANEIHELLAHANVQAGDLEKAKEYYQKLMVAEPANPMHARNYQQVAEKQGTTSTEHAITAEEGTVLVEELEATSPFVEQKYDDETSAALRAALTDAELFISYNMPAKALEPLLTVLPKAPRDLRVNQKLAALHTRAGKFAEAAVCCRTLESIYRDSSHSEEAAKYADLAGRYEQRAGVVSTGLVAAETSPAAPAAEFEIAAPVVGHTDEPDTAPHPAPAAVIPHAAAIAPPPVPAKATTTPNGVFFHSPTAVPEPPAAVPEPLPPAPEPQAAAPAPVAIPEAPVPTVEAEPAATEMSGEWEQDLEVDAPHIAPAIEEPAPAAVHAAPEPEPVETHAVPEIEAEAPAPVSAVPRLDEGIEEVRFYLGQGMVEQAEQALAKLEALAPDSPELAVLRLGIDSAKQTSAEPVAEAEISIEEAPEVELEVEQPEPAPPARKAGAPSMSQPWPQERPAAPAPKPEPPRPTKKEAERPVLQELVSDLESSLGDDFLESSTPSAPVKTHRAIPEPEEAPVAASPAFRSGTLDDFVSDLEASLGGDFESGSQPAAHSHGAPMAHAAAASASAIPSAPAVHPPQRPASKPAPPAPKPAPSFDSAAGVDLANMFGELKEELEEEKSSVDEDPETHYNLGVAFREMGLLDEAIGEFQKVCQAAEHGQAFPQLMQTYTWLAQCFLDKGIPEAAIRWYETALKMPSIDQETRTALHYELASAFETAGNKQSALSNFLEVYGSNIDYRDVAERISALRQ